MVDGHSACARPRLIVRIGRHAPRRGAPPAAILRPRPGRLHRAPTPLELLYDLTIVVAIGTAADELAHYVAEDHIGAGVGGFAFAAFAVVWAWLNYSWFASAYDTDDWVFRLATMVQMAGVIVVSLGPAADVRLARPRRHAR